MCKNGVHARKLNNMVWIHLKSQALNQLWARFTLQCENWTQRMTCTSLSSSFCFSRWTRFGIVIPSTWCSHVQYTMLFSSNGHIFILLFSICTGTGSKTWQKRPMAGIITAWDQTCFAFKRWEEKKNKKNPATCIWWNWIMCIKEHTQVLKKKKKKALTYNTFLLPACPGMTYLIALMFWVTSSIHTPLLFSTWTREASKQQERKIHTFHYLHSASGIQRALLAPVHARSKPSHGTLRLNLITQCTEYFT